MEELMLKAAGASGGFVLAVVLIALLKGWLVVGSQYQREIANSDKWEQRYLEVMGVIRAQAAALKESAETAKAIARSSPP